MIPRDHRDVTPINIASVIWDLVKAMFSMASELRRVLVLRIVGISILLGSPVTGRWECSRRVGSGEFLSILRTALCWERNRGSWSWRVRMPNSNILLGRKKTSGHAQSSDDRRDMLRGGLESWS